MSEKTPVELWVEALRSGEFEQGRERLTRDGKDCCLGVACKVYIRHGGDLKTLRYADTVVYDGQEHVLPDPVRKWLGLQTRAGFYGTSRAAEHSLGGHNDDDGWTFEQIADLIESRPPGLFKDEA